MAKVEIRFSRKDSFNDDNEEKFTLVVELPYPEYVAFDEVTLVGMQVDYTTMKKTDEESAREAEEKKAAFNVWKTAVASDKTTLGYDEWRHTVLKGLKRPGAEIR